MKTTIQSSRAGTSNRRPLHSINSILGAALLTTASPAYLDAQSWDTVDAFQLPGLDWCQALNLDVDSSGRLFVAGRGFASGMRGGSLAVRRSLDQGDTWQTVFTLDDLQYQDGFGSFKVLSGAPGKMFITAGTGSSAWQGGPDAMHWLVYRSDDGGDSWTNVDDFVLSPNYPAIPTAATADSLGNIYVGGYAYPDSPPGQWKPVMRRSTDDGQTWTTLNLPTYAGPGALATTPHGLFAVGQTDYVWKVWRSTNNGTTWSTVDTFSLGPDGLSTALAVAADTAGNLFVVGEASPDSHPGWVVRRSSDGGVNWTTVDNYVTAANFSRAQAITVDNAGRLWVAGEDVRSWLPKNGSWLVRRSDDLSANWVNSDVFSIPGRFPAAISLAADAAGNVFAAGYGATPENELHAEFWMVRKLAAPPRLAMEASNGSPQLTWPANATSFVLQSATTLTHSGDWQDFPTAPTEIDGLKVVTITGAGPGGFFRLHQP